MRPRCTSYQRPTPGRYLHCTHSHIYENFILIQLLVSKLSSLNLYIVFIKFY